VKKSFCIGIDEVGRGPIAGPVCVAAFQLRITNEELRIQKRKTPLRDSKKLTRLQREAWFVIIKGWQKEGKCDFAISYVSAKIIDRIGIAPAIKKALFRSLLQLKASSLQLILLDGGLKAPLEFKNQKTIIKGDEKEPAIALASIVAKVYRDRLIRKHAKTYPNHGFENHVGYGTRAHYKAIKKHGLTPLHRQSFLKRLQKSKEKGLLASYR